MQPMERSSPVGMVLETLPTNSMAQDQWWSIKMELFISPTEVRIRSKITIRCSEYRSPHFLRAFSDNYRVQRWLPNANSGLTIVGGTVGVAADQLNGLETICVDENWNLFVVDSNNHRVQFFNATEY